MRNSKPVFLGFAGIISVLVFVYGAWGLYNYFLATNQGEPVPSGEIITTTSDRPSEKKPDESAVYEVAADHPRMISIPVIGVSAFTQPLGVAPSGEMATPTNIYFTGWYVHSPTPGDVGVSIVNGHAGGRYNPGVFKDLKGLKSGDAIHVQMGDRSMREFSVVSVEAYPLADAIGPLFRDNPGIEEELHLITCDGIYDDTSQSYSHRVIVVAKRTSSV